MCGEHKALLFLLLTIAGSSPHVRGTHGPSARHGRRAGIIPACAGNTMSAVSCIRWAWDHPRMCGEHNRNERGNTGTAGIIPACAGNTIRGSFVCCRFRDHPRMCGEHSRMAMMRSMKAGSSPHVRGTPERPWSARPRPGIIPACAGNTAISGMARTAARDHPRMCGEHDGEEPDWETEPGSSPHVRGTPDLRGKLVDHLRIIPACAGNTNRSMQSRTNAGDHPRMCGEHFTGRSPTCSPVGSSPHVRGTPSVVEVQETEIGIIPACAGNTRVDGSTSGMAWDHPRMCGEHLLLLRSRKLKSGSSPHVRGTPAWTGQHPAWRGIIPACAGNTRRRLLRDKRLLGSSPHVRGTPGAVRGPDDLEGIIPACAGNTRWKPRSSQRARDHPRMCGEHISPVSIGNPLPGSSPHVRGTPATAG